MANQIYNFLDYRLKPEVSYDVTVCDDFIPENLLLPIPAPFKAYNVVKPPIELKFKFLCDVNILFIKIYGQVDSLKSTAFEISNNDIGQIAYATSDIAEQIGICFYRRDVPDNCTGLNISRLFRNIRPVSEIVLKILRTNKCPPVLRRVEVWGNVARNCTIDKLQLIESLWNQNTACSSESEQHNLLHMQKVEIIHKNPSFQIPEEFLDEITCEIMCIPFTLPSGKVVDEKTIEQHNTNEAEWSRLPSDPFTGQTYNSNRKPIFNASLKARIDAFLVLHSEKVKNVPRTTGTKSLMRKESVINQNSIKSIDFKPGMSFEAQVQLALSTIRNTRSQTTAFTENVCQKCKKNEFLYQIINCKHLICRNCLIGNKASRVKCNPCSTYFTRTDVQKYHNFF